MSTSPVSAEARDPFRIAGLPLSSWAYAFRIWIAMMLALCTAFWLQLDDPSSAAVAVAILSQPRRGDAFRKAAFRLGATIVAVIASIVIVAVFPQQPDLYIFAYAGWLALTVYIGLMFDGARAYGIVLAGFTVALVAVTQIDTPLNVFMNGLGRLASGAVGIASIGLIDDVLAAPTVYPSVCHRLLEAHERVRELVRSMATSEPWQAARAVDLLTALTGTRLDILAVSAESPSGSARSRAAASAATAMIEAVASIRALSLLSRGLPTSDTSLWRDALTHDDDAALEAVLDQAMTGPERSPDRVVCPAIAVSLIAHLRLASQELGAMEAAHKAQRRTKMPVHRDHELARLAACRIFIVVVGSGYVFALSSWPMTSGAWAIVGVLAALSATMPNPRAFAKGVMIAVPIAFVVAGVTEYALVDGADAFPLLMMGFAPAIFCGCLLFLNPKTALLGFLILVFSLVIFPPSNPQDYSEQSYIYSGALDIGGAFLFSALLFCFFPVSDKDRRRWMVNRARTNLREAADGRSTYAAHDMAYLTADRIVALSRFRIGLTSARQWRVRYMLLLSNLTLAAGRGHRALDEIARQGAPLDVVTPARDAIAHLDPSELSTAARKLMVAVPLDYWGSRQAAITAIADLTATAQLIEANYSMLRHMRHARA